MADAQKLVSWKRIARYLDRGERTVRRWAAEEGLPVHRVARNRSVYAFTNEIDAWLQTRAVARPAAEETQARPVLAFLPIENLTGDPSLDTTIDGLTEEAISLLGCITEIGVIARTSVLAYKGTQASIKEIGGALGADLVVEGSARAERDLIRVTLQLIDVQDQTHRWASSFDHRLESPLAMQRDVAARAVRDIRRVLTGSADEISAPAQGFSGSVADEYYHGRYLLNQMRADKLIESVAAFDRALEQQPDFAPALGGKAEALQLMTIYNNADPAEVMPAAMTALNQAVVYDPASAEVYASLGFIHATYTREWAASEQAFKRSLHLNPSLVIAHQWFAESLATQGRFDEALQHAEVARRLDPLSLAVETSRGHVLWLARRYDELIPAMQRVLAKEPNYPLAHILLFCAYFEQGHYAEAAQASENALQATQEQMPFVVFLSLCACAQGDSSAVNAVLEMMGDIPDDVFLNNYMPAICHIVLDNRDEAIRYLRKAAKQRVWHITMIGQCAMEDSLREEPAFDALLKDIGLYENRYISADKAT